MHRRRLPLSYSCPRPLDTMPLRSETERWCDSCDRSVFDLSAMSEGEARRLLDANVGKEMCISYRFDREGRLAFGERASRRRVLARAGWTLVVTVSLAGCLTGKPAHDIELSDPESEPSTPEVDARPSTIGVVVVDNRTGQPLTDATVRVRSSLAEHVGQADEQGTHDFEVFGPGHYDVEIVAGLARATERVLVDVSTRVELTFRIDPSFASDHVHRSFDDEHAGERATVSVLETPMPGEVQPAACGDPGGTDVE